MSNWVWDEFGETPIMSTYLVAFIICEFKYVQAVVPNANNVLFRVFGREGVLDQVGVF